MALETSYLADEGASLPELPLKSPLTVGIPDKPLNINRSISTVPDLVTPITERPQSETSLLVSKVPSVSTPNSAPVSEASLLSSVTTCMDSLSSSVCNDVAQHSISDQFPGGHLLDDGAVNKTFSTSLQGNDDSELIEHDPNKLRNLSGSNYREQNGKVQPLKEEFSSAPTDGQSILVSLTTRCVWKGVVCERAHLFRIQYYRNFDKPLGRFLLDDLFDQV